MPQVKVQVTFCLHDQVVTCQRPAKTSKYALKRFTSHNIMPSKPYLIKGPPKHVHQIPPFQNKPMLKDLIQFAKFRYGRGVIVSYWVSQSSSRGCFQGETSLGHVVNVKWMGLDFQEWGFMTYKGSYCLIYGCLCRGCAALRPRCNIFASPFVNNSLEYFHVEDVWGTKLINKKNPTYALPWSRRFPKLKTMWGTKLSNKKNPTHALPWLA
jgi:hypothetical protein